MRRVSQTSLRKTRSHELMMRLAGPSATVFSINSDEARPDVASEYCNSSGRLCPTISIWTWAVPSWSMPSCTAAAWERSSMRPFAYGPRSVMRTWRSAVREVHHPYDAAKLGIVRCAAVSASMSNISPLAACLPWEPLAIPGGHATVLDPDVKLGLPFWSPGTCAQQHTGNSKGEKYRPIRSRSIVCHRQHL